jgi:hypothetical protein
MKYQAIRLLITGPPMATTIPLEDPAVRSPTTTMAQKDPTKSNFEVSEKTSRDVGR